MGLRLPSSVGSVAASEFQRRQSSSSPNASAMMQVDVEHDLVGVGAWAEAEAGRMEGYPGELEIMG